MSGPDNRSDLEFFNNSTLSDVIIKQIYNGEAREYYAHKAVLCMNSKYFLRAFTGDFKEATSNVIELHDDKPDDFEALLKSIYAIDHDTNTFGDLILANDTKSVSSLVDLYVVADKYDVTRISTAAVQAARSALRTTDEDLIPVIKAFYNGTAMMDSEMGRAITEKVIALGPGLISTANIEELIHSYSTFGADVGLAMLRRPELTRVSRNCTNNRCDHRNEVTKDMLESGRHSYHCICGHQFYL